MPELNSEILIYVPAVVAASAVLPPDESSEHSLSAIGEAVRRVVSVRTEGVRDQWNRTLDMVMGLSSAIAERSAAWTIDELEVGLTLSAKGELLFIAEGGAEASIKFKLKPKI